MFKITAILALGALGVGAAQAQVSLVGYPAPGGNSFSSTGSSLTSPGATGTYSGFDPSAYGSLYWAIDPPVLTGNGSGGVMSFDAADSNLAQGIEVWRGTTTIPNGGSLGTVYTEFTLDVTDNMGQALALTAAGSIPGMPTSVAAALSVPSTGFEATKLFEMSTTSGSGYAPAQGFYDSVFQRNPGYGLTSSVNGSFYATAAVPEPATTWLMIAGLPMLLFIVRRNRLRGVGSEGVA